MSTTTPRLGIIKPATSDSPKNFDDEVGSALEATDLYFGARELAADPGPTFVGELYKNTTNENYRRWTGAKWAWVGHQTAHAKSYESSFSHGSLVSNVAGLESVVVFTNPFTYIQNRRYKVRFMLMLEYDASTSGFFRVNLRWAAGTVVGVSDPSIKEFRFFVDSTGFMSKQAEAVFDYPHVAATQTGVMCVTARPETAVDWHAGGVPGSGGTNTSNSSMMIRDWGP